MNTLAIADHIPYNSIIADRSRGDTSNSSDGVVPRTGRGVFGLPSGSHPRSNRGRLTKGDVFRFRALTPFCDRFHAAASFPSLLLAPLGKFAVGQRKCYLHFREGKILSCAPGQNQNGGWL